MSEADPEATDTAEGTEATGSVGFRCDFCGRESPRVRRVALDRDYERLRTPHQVRYACPDCSERKERERANRSA